eukprot:356920-Chlamydomonas_euryale.AAC.2
MEDQTSPQKRHKHRKIEDMILCSSTSTWSMVMHGSPTLGDHGATRDDLSSRPFWGEHVAGWHGQHARGQVPVHSLLSTLHTGFSRRNNFHTFFAKSQSLQRAPLTRPGSGSTALTGYHVSHYKGLHNISHSRHGERKTMSYAQSVGAS